MVKNLRDAMNSISPEMVERWVEDLVIFKTFIGMRFQEAVLKEVAALRGTHYRLAEPDEEARGIDGFIGDRPVAIKPATYRSKPSLREALEGEIIFYTKKRDGIEIELGP
jgi:hypothetical protein